LVSLQGAAVVTTPAAPAPFSLGDARSGGLLKVIRPRRRVRLFQPSN
jgi:hypothetical protein